MLLDLFSGAGGCTKGYQRAGFYVVGVDKEPQPNYCGDDFIRGDALDALENPALWTQFSAISASPPCQAYSDLKTKIAPDAYPKLIGEVRRLLNQTRLPYVIENVEGAPLSNPVMLCGTMFPGLRVIRHRLFEANFPLFPRPHGKHPLVFTHDRRKRHYGQLDQDKSFVQVTGGGNCSIANARAAMGIDWMTKHEINEAIPPAYTEHVGWYLMGHLEGVREETAA